MRFTGKMFLRMGVINFMRVVLKIIHYGKTGTASVLMSANGVSTFINSFASNHSYYNNLNALISARMLCLKMTAVLKKAGMKVTVVLEDRLALLGGPANGEE